MQKSSNHRRVVSTVRPGAAPSPVRRAARFAAEALEGRTHFAADLFGQLSLNSTTLTVGTSVSSQMTMVNPGPEATSAPVRIGTYISKDNVFDPATDRLLRQSTPMVMDGNRFFGSSGPLNLPGKGDAFWDGTGDGGYFIFAYADDTFAEAETNEANNSQGLAVTVSGTNTAPAVNGAVANQPVLDTATIAPFATVTVTDPDPETSVTATVTITNGANRGDFSAGTGGWTRSTGGDDVVYTRTFASPGATAATQSAVRALTFDPRSDAVAVGSTETTSFTVAVSDGVATVTNSATSVVATSVNSAPSFLAGENVSGNEDAGAVSVPNWATSVSGGPGVESSQTVTFTVVAGDTSLFTVQPAVSSAGTLTYTPAPDAFGQTTLTITAADNGGTANGGINTSASQSAQVRVNAVNDVPTFTKGPDQSIDVNAGPQSVPGWASGISPGPANEAGQGVEFLTTNDNPSLFRPGGGAPSIDPSGNLTYEAALNSSGSATVTVRVRDDGGTADGGVDTSAAQTFTITVASPVTFGVGDAAILEGDAGVQAMLFSVTRNTATGVGSVDFATADGTAGAPGDYNSVAPTSVVFLPGETEKFVTVGVRGDTNVEGNQDLFVNLSNPSEGTISDGQGVGTIVNDDFAPPRIAVADAAVTEGNAGTTVLTFKVSLSAKTDELVTVKYKTTANSATSGTDFTSATGTLKFGPFQTEATVTVLVKGDLSTESAETFYLDLSAPTNATILDGRGVGTIVNDDAKPKITILDAPSVVEGNSGTKLMTFTVKLSNPTAGSVTVKYATADGTAQVSKNDYKAKTGTLTFAAGETTKTITVTVVGDTRKGTPTETLFVNLSAPTNATILDGQGVGTILNDDF